MASIKQRKSSFSVIYWYLDSTGERKQKWDTLETRKEAKQRKAFIEYYQEKFGYVIVPLEEQFAHQIEDSKKDLEVADKDITLREFLKIFVNLYGTSKWSPSTLRITSIHLLVIGNLMILPQRAYQNIIMIY